METKPNRFRCPRPPASSTPGPRSSSRRAGPPQNSPRRPERGGRTLPAHDRVADARGSGRQHWICEHHVACPPGSGKGYLARILYELSPRAGRPFVTQNCGVFTESLAEAKLFGNVKGAFTGATESRAGLVEAAAGGTLFLDELGALPLAVQPMLLTFLETGEFNPLGSTAVRRADVRVIGATNRDLGLAIAERVFRADLVGRLSPRYRVPPLRQRRGRSRESPGASYTRTTKKRGSGFSSLKTRCTGCGTTIGRGTSGSS